MRDQVEAGREPYVIDAFGVRWLLDLRNLDDQGDPLAGQLRSLWSATRVVADEETVAALSAAGRVFNVERHENRMTLFSRSVLLSDRLSPEDIPYQLSGVLTLESLQRRVGDALLLHAAGVARPDGRTVVLVARSGTGKTTAAHHLGSTWGYVSDETICIEFDHRISPYPKPLSIIQGGRGAKHESSPAELGLLPAPEGLHLGAVVVLDRQPDASESTMQPIGLVPACLDVLTQTSGLLRMERPLERLAAALVTGNGPWKLTYRDISECGQLVARVLDPGDETELPEPVSYRVIDGNRPPQRPRAADPDPPLGASISSDDPAPPPALVTPERTLLHGETRVGRGDFYQSIVSDGEALVLMDRPVRLPDLACVLWEALEEPMSLTDLVDVAETRLGSHPESQTIVIRTVSAMIDTGALVVLDP